MPECLWSISISDTIKATNNVVINGTVLLVQMTALFRYGKSFQSDYSTRSDYSIITN